MADYFDNSAELILKPFKKPIAEIMQELKDDAPNFVSEMKVDPTGYLISKLYPDEKIKHQPKISAANRFLFAILGNDGFRDWLKDYHVNFVQKANESGYAEFDPQQIRKDFAEGLKSHADEAVVQALVEAAELGPIEIIDNYIGSDNRQIAAAVVGPVAVAVAVAAVVVTAVMYVAYTSPEEELLSGTLSAFAYSGNELVNLSDEMIQTAKNLRDEGKL